MITLTVTRKGLRLHPARLARLGPDWRQAFERVPGDALQRARASIRFQDRTGQTRAGLRARRESFGAIQKAILSADTVAAVVHEYGGTRAQSWQRQPLARPVRIRRRIRMRTAMRQAFRTFRNGVVRALRAAGL